MKKMLLNKLCATIILSCILFTALPVAATTYLSDELIGTSAYSDNVVLGSGTRYFYGEATYSEGNAKAYKVVPWAPDTKVGSTLYLDYNDGEDSTSFTAKKTNSDGEDQEYYMYWKGSKSKASAWLAFSN